MDLALLPALLATALAVLDGPAPDLDAFERHALAVPGDADRGRLLFRDEDRTACDRCHRVDGEGGEIGPDLSDVGSKLDRPLLIESVLRPSRQIVEGYRPTRVATRDGRVMTGLERGERGGALVLVDAEAREVLVPLETIEERATADVSLMPEGLADMLSTDEFADLVAYLESLRSSGPSEFGAGISGPIALPPGFVRETVAEGITGATALAVAPDGRVFVCEQVGRLRIVDGGRLLPEPFATLEVDDHWERGLLGVTLDPDFAHNGFVYTVSVAPSPYPHHRISRFKADGNRAESGREVILFEGDDQSTLGGNVPAGHQGGAIHFGRDGKLYVALGEQTAGAPSQRLDSLLGKILRLNPDGSIPEDNPLLDRSEGKYRAIWAYGCRNVFTFAVQPGTGLILLNDVGGEAEEINVGRPGANYGWPIVEHGPTDRTGVVGPIHWYPTASIAGGAFCPSLPVEGASPTITEAGISSWISSRAGFGPSTPTTRLGRSRPRRSPPASSGRSTWPSPPTVRSWS